MSILQATGLPSQLIILGAGAVALEFAQIYRRLGAASLATALRATR